MEQGHQVDNVHFVGLHIGKETDGAITPKNGHSNGCTNHALDLVPEVHDSVLVVTLDSHHVEENDGCENQDEHKGRDVVDEKDLDGKLLPGNEAVWMGAEDVT